MNPWISTGFHFLLCSALVLGVLFSETRTQQLAILGTLVIVFFGVRFNRGCFVTALETSEDKPSLTELGKALYLRDWNSVTNPVFEEILVANLLFLQILRILACSILPIKELFQA
jgi:hypothetical protein